MAKGKSQPIDAHVGRRMKERRTFLGLSQKKVAEAIHLSLRQVQKYEEGIDRVGASRLFDIARVLEVPVNYFFQELDEETPVVAVAPTLDKRETRDLVQAYYRIADPKVRRYVYLLTKSLGKQEEASDLQ